MIASQGFDVLNLEGLDIDLFQSEECQCVLNSESEVKALKEVDSLGDRG
jgi:hypothetical protein